MLLPDVFLYNLLSNILRYWISAIDGTDGFAPFLFNTLQFYYKLKFWTCKEVLLQ